MKNKAKTPKKPVSTATAKSGVNHVAGIVESCNSIFHRIPQENDFGNDAFIELVDGDEVKGITLAVQIKSGKSFCTKEDCKIPASLAQLNYWKNHSLKVIGIVYDPTEKMAYWIDISWHLERNREVIEKGPFVIAYKKKENNAFTTGNFKNIFLPLFLGKNIYLSESKAIRFSLSEDFDLHYMGLRVLMSHYRNKKSTWDLFFQLIDERDPKNISDILVYFLAHGPGHPDIFWHKDNDLNEEIRGHIKTKLKNANVNFVGKILAFMDEDDEWERGSLGQNVEAVISGISNKNGKLMSIGMDPNNSKLVRESAGYLIAYYKQKKSLRDLRKICEGKGMSDSFLIEVVKMIKEEGYFYFY